MREFRDVRKLVEKVSVTAALYDASWARKKAKKDISPEDFEYKVTKLEDEGKIPLLKGRDLRKEFKAVRLVFEAEEK